MSARIGLLLCAASALLPVLGCTVQLPIAAEEDAGETLDAGADTAEDQAQPRAGEKQAKPQARGSSRETTPKDKGTPQRADSGARGADADSDAGIEAADAAGSADDGPEILTQRYGNARTGVNLNERVLKPDNVSKLSLLGSFNVDGEIYAQVLVAAGVKVDGDGTGSAAGVVRAFDPTTLKVLWQADIEAWSKFNPPTVVRGRVFVPSTSPSGTHQQVLVYGLP